MRNFIVRAFYKVLTAVCFINIYQHVNAQQTLQPVDYVNPYMGNISHLLVPTYPTIHLPNSLLRMHPDKGSNEGYSGMRLFGLPCILTGHRGTLAFKISPFQGDERNIKPVMAYSYDLENITPYSYSVFLDEQQTEVLFAPSHLAAIYEMKFEQQKPVSLIINSVNGTLKWTGEVVQGFQLLENDVKVFICLESEIHPESVGILSEEMDMNKTEMSGRNATIILRYGIEPALRIRYGISLISEDQARKNMLREINTFDIHALTEYGRKTWNEALSKILVEGGTENDKNIFYTSLYRCYERPVCISEDGKYFSGFDKKVHDDEGVPYYTDDWFWDTYHAMHPLHTILNPTLEEKFINSLIRNAEQSDRYWMPMFPTITGDAFAMNGNHGVATIIDAYEKGLRGFDLEKAYRACRGALTEKTLIPWSGEPAGELDRFYQEKGYFPALAEGEKETISTVNAFEKRQAVAVTLGASYDAWCLSQIAKRLNKNTDYQYFFKQSFNYRNLFNPQTQFFHPKNSIGEFIQPFNYKFSGGFGSRDYYDENNGWTYRWEVKHNINDLINLMGGRENFIKTLDATFIEPLGKSRQNYYAQSPDHTGNVGQYSMGNEPSFHIPYLYNYAGEPWKTQKLIRALLNMWFRNDLMGIPGDEDGGGMSAFVVFSKMGFYPVTPGIPAYNMGSPAFSLIIIKLGNDKEFRIVAKNCSEDNKYIQSAILNGRAWNKPWFSHGDIQNGGMLILEMGNKANKLWGASPESAPPSAESIN